MISNNLAAMGSVSIAGLRQKKGPAEATSHMAVGLPA